MQYPVHHRPGSCTLPGRRRLLARDLVIPGDVSAAAFFLAGAALRPGSDVMIRGVGINPTRTGFLDVLRRMGASLTVTERPAQTGEPVADIRVQGTGRLAPIIVGRRDIPGLIDELPLVAVLGCAAHGTTIIRDAEELRAKETDRIAIMTSQLRRLGGRVYEQPDGMVIEGPNRLHGTTCDSHGDHRIAMALTIAALGAAGFTTVNHSNCIDISFPGYYPLLRSLLVPE